jgi:hypothetical protein
MNIWKRIAIAIISALGLFAVHEGVNALFQAHHWKSMSAGDWGTWIGSIGTVAALMMTIRIATAAKREAQKYANDRAVVAAAALGPRLQRIGDALQSVVENVLNESQKTAAGYRSCADLIEAAGAWTDDEILPLIVLSEHVCTRLAGARPIMQNAVKELRLIAEPWPRTSGDEPFGERIGRIAGDLIICRDIVQFATNKCKAIVKNAIQN